MCHGLYLCQADSDKSNNLILFIQMEKKNILFYWAVKVNVQFRVLAEDKDTKFNSVQLLKDKTLHR